MKINAGDGTYVTLELLPRRTVGAYDKRQRIVERDVEASCTIRTGPASFAVVTFDPNYLADLGWALLTASHKLARLQGGASLEAAVEDDPQLTIYDALAEVSR